MTRHVVDFVKLSNKCVSAEFAHAIRVLWLDWTNSPNALNDARNTEIEMIEKQKALVILGMLSMDMVLKRRIRFIIYVCIICVYISNSNMYCSELS